MSGGIDAPIMCARARLAFFLDGNESVQPREREERLASLLLMAILLFRLRRMRKVAGVGVGEMKAIVCFEKWHEVFIGSYSYFLFREERGQRL